MATKFDWNTSYLSLKAAIETTDAIEYEIGLAILEEMGAIGEPYDAAWTDEIAASKDANEDLIGQTIDEWYFSAQDAHNQATHGLNFVETKYTDLTVINYPAFSSITTNLATNKGLISSKLRVYAAKTQGTEYKVQGWQNEGMPAVLLRYRADFLEAYEGFEQPVFTGAYGAELLVPVPGRGTLTMYQAEVLLYGYVFEAERMVEMTNY
jgi:hypothetical protein